MRAMDDLPYLDSADMRADRWASTMAGHDRDDIVLAHADSRAEIGATKILTREEREAREDATLAEFATRAHGAGNRALEEAPDPHRTCFERDRDRILHDTLGASVSTSIAMPGKCCHVYLLRRTS